MGTIGIIANILSFIGNFLFTSSSIFKKKRTIITLQTTNHFLSSIAQALQHAYSGMMQDCTMLVKNIILLFVKEDKRILKLVINVICILVALGGGIALNIILSDNVWYGYFPVLGTFYYSVFSTFVFVKKNLSQDCTEVLLKHALIVNGVCWIIYGIYVQLIAVYVFNSITIVASIVSILFILFGKKKDSIENVEG